MEFIKIGRHARDLTGRRFGRLEAIGPVGRKEMPAGNKHIIWLCRCECGKEKGITAQPLIDGRTRSCGCGQRESAAAVGKANVSHGGTKSSEWRIWSAMRGRCNSSKNSLYAKYGAIGITVCDRWDRFENFLADMGPRPSSKHSIDRYPNQAGNYDPGNCRWATSDEQNQNLSSNKIVIFAGRTGALSSFFEGGSNDPNYDRVRQRLSSGWSVDRAMRW